MNRREFVAAAGIGGASAATGIAASMQPLAATSTHQPAGARSNGRLKQSVCRWCYGRMALEDLCRHAAKIGMASVELLGESEWSVPAQFGLTCAVANGPSGITDAWNRLDNHDKLVAESERLLPLIAEAGLPSMIVFSGNRGGMSDEEGLRNCAAGLKRITPLAEQVGVTVIMELLNSRVDHGDYMCDRTPWGVALVDEVASDRFRLLYDIYHMQIMEGDVIRTITDHSEYIAHYHTGGVPGRNEIDNSQELNYDAICRAIVETGYQGYLGQEFIPKHDPMTSLRNAAAICDV